MKMPTVTAATSRAAALALVVCGVTSGSSAQKLTADPPVAVRCVSADARWDDPLSNPEKKQVARMLISSAENSSLRWESQFSYIEYNVERDESENRGYTGGIVGFTSKTHDMLLVVERYARTRPSNPLTPFLSALRAADGTSSSSGLGEDFVAAWVDAATDPAFQQAQVDVADVVYFEPAVARAVADGLGALGQFIYVDAMVMHGPGEDSQSFGGIRRLAVRRAKTPAGGGDERDFLSAFLDVRVPVMRREVGHRDVSRVEQQQRRFLREGNLGLELPLSWSTYGDDYAILPWSDRRCPRP